MDYSPLRVVCVRLAPTLSLGTFGVLREASDRIIATVTELYSAPTAEWFMRKHGRTLLDPARFDPRIGFNICVFLPMQ